jgi:hypothetical protein
MGKLFQLFLKEKAGFFTDKKISIITMSKNRRKKIIRLDFAQGMIITC